MANITARVVPRSARTSVTVTPDGGLVIRVRSAPEAGRATLEAARALAQAIGVSSRAVSLRVGARSRTKVFAVDGLSEEDLASRLRSL